MKYTDDNLEWHDENELVRRLDVVESVLNLADTIDDVIDVIMSVPTYTADRKTEPQTCDTCKFADKEWYEEPCDRCGYMGKYEPKTEPQTDCSWK